MPPRPIHIATTLATAGTALAIWMRWHRLRRALLQERAARRLTDAAWHRDVTAFDRRLTELIGQQHTTSSVLAEADQVLDTALATHHQNPQEGGPS